MVSFFGVNSVNFCVISLFNDYLINIYWFGSWFIMDWVNVFMLYGDGMNFVFFLNLGRFMVVMWKLLFK